MPVLRITRLLAAFRALGPVGLSAALATVGGVMILVGAGMAWPPLAWITAGTGAVYVATRIEV